MQRALEHSQFLANDRDTFRPRSSNPWAWTNRSGVSFEPPWRSAALKNTPAPCSRNRLTQRLTVTRGTPKASTICLWLAVLLTINWLLYKRKAPKSSAACVNTGR